MEQHMKKENISQKNLHKELKKKISVAARSKPTH